eukprot:5684684-Amphidinium_carterae.1
MGLGGIAAALQGGMPLAPGVTPLQLAADTKARRAYASQPDLLHTNHCKQNSTPTARNYWHYDYNSKINLWLLPTKRSHWDLIPFIGAM